ncbi:simple sugar transport system ATP-binding protein [Neorhizobium galegae]|uniref:sugar ABC transporter ATP-binding protein n=1 Tax=Neorhizobium galegae TaxID=399 RepID=UPI00277FDA47|nr:simple sugar transport system ATP-binding protein [Neorhizobium galegae]
MTFGGVQALKDVSFDLLPGEVHCLAGENGCGKSTLIKIIAGTYQPNDGSEIYYNGKLTEKNSPAIARERGIQVIWQDLALFPEMTVAENIAIDSVLSARLTWVNHSAMRITARRCLKRLGVELDVERPLRTCAIAERQLVAIARALASDAKVIFMDEPTASLTRYETNNLLKIVRQLAAEGVAIVFVSHRLAEVLEISNRITVLRDGALVGVYPAKGMTQNEVTKLMTGKDFPQKIRARDTSANPVVLQVSNLSRVGEFRDLNFQVRKGEILGITGLLGAGRTELALALFGMTKPSAGTFHVNGKACSFRSNKDAIKKGIAYLSEDRLSVGLIQQQSIADNIAVAAMHKVLRNGFLSTTKKTTLVAHWLEELRIKSGPQTNPVSTLSGGNQQRVAIAKWLNAEPDLLILDSPSVGVDVGARAGIFAIVDRLAESGLAIIIISDEISEVYYNSDRILHMRGGRFVSCYDPQKSTIEEIEADVYA